MYSASCPVVYIPIGCVIEQTHNINTSMFKHECDLRMCVMYSAMNIARFNRRVWEYYHTPSSIAI